MLIVAEHEQLPVAEARMGESEAWDILFHRYQLPLYTYVCELVHDEQSSLDIVQETFISATRYLGSLREDAKFGSWLFGIAHQKCIQRWRRPDCNTTALDAVSDYEYACDDDPAEGLIRQEQAAQFMALLDQLPIAQRSALLLYYLEEFSLAEIAAITEASLGTVKSRLHYAKKTLKQLWEAQNENTA
jgi:RNA polymerase sigma-70 factor, ECF subfamily